MRYAIPVLAVCMLLAVGCKKRCTCKTFVNDAVAVYHDAIPLDKSTHDKCSDMDSIVSLDPKEGEECVNY